MFRKIGLNKIELLISSLLIFLAGFLRFYDLSSRSIHHDESLHGFFSWQFSNGMGFEHNPLMHGVFWFLANGTIFFLFGDNDFTLRVLSAIFGIILVLIPILLLKDKIGFLPSFIMSLLFTISPHLLYFSRFARNDIIIVVWTMGLFVFLWRYLEKRQNSSLYMLVIFLVLGFITKETSYITVFIIGLWLLFKSRSDFYGLIFSKMSMKKIKPHTDLFIVFFTLSLPLASPLIGIFQDYFNLILVAKEGTVGVSTGLPSGSNGYIVAVIVSALFFLVSLIIGLLWGGKKWLLIASLFWGIYILFYSTFLTNVSGISTGVWQSLGYWISQQEVARGGQPWYYYFIVFINYEFLPFYSSFIALIYYIFKGDSFRKFLVYWVIATFLLYSLAGEKMPWLTVNIVVPFIVLTSIFTSDIIKKIYSEKRSLFSNIIFILIPLIILFSIFSFFITDWTNLNIESFISIWIYITLILLSCYYLIFYTYKNGISWTSKRVFLSISLILIILTIRISTQSSFDDPDVPDEMIVYTQTSPHVHAMSKRIYSESLNKLGNKNLKISIDTSDGYTWPWAWYLRDFENTEYVNFDNYDDNLNLQSDILIVHQRNKETIEIALGDNIKDYDQNLIPLRWWYPENYRMSNYDDFIDKISNFENIQGMMNYFFFRDLETSIGSVNTIVYIKSDM